MEKLRAHSRTTHLIEPEAIGLQCGQRLFFQFALPKSIASPAEAEGIIRPWNPNALAAFPVPSHDRQFTSLYSLGQLEQ
jgi:hypothetical protein